MLIASFASLFLLIGAGSAQALPKTPKLGGTYPASPGLSTTPRVFGWVDEVFVSRFDLRGRGPRTAAAGEEGTIAVYAQPGCTGPEVASGTASDLENSGIPVTVALGSTTAFSVTNTDLTGTSACSNSIEYRQVSDPPAAPIVSAVSPGSPADDNHPHVVGSADSGSTVTIYADPGCAGSPVGSGSAEAFAVGGVEATVADNTTTSFYARASWAGLPSPCSATSVGYQEVTVAAPPGGGNDGGSGGDSGGSSGSGGGTAAPGGPSAGPAPAAPKIHTVPGGRANDSLPLVQGSAPAGTRVQIYKNSPCAGRPTVTGPASQLSDGFQIAVAEDATTRFYAEAVDGAGKTSECSEPAVYAEDSSPPLTRITFGPGVKTRKRVAVFRFTDIADEAPGTTFSCKFDRRPWRACQTPFRVSRLRFRVHTLKVKATDGAGNEEARGASRRFKVVHAGL